MSLSQLNLSQLTLSQLNLSQLNLSQLSLSLSLWERVVGTGYQQKDKTGTFKRHYPKKQPPKDTTGYQQKDFVGNQ